MILDLKDSFHAGVSPKHLNILLGSALIDRACGYFKFSLDCFI